MFRGVDGHEGFFAVYGLCCRLASALILCGLAPAMLAGANDTLGFNLFLSFLWLVGMESFLLRVLSTR